MCVLRRLSDPRKIKRATFCFPFSPQIPRQERYIHSRARVSRVTIPHALSKLTFSPIVQAQGWSWKILEESAGSDGGFKAVTVEVGLNHRYVDGVFKLLHTPHPTSRTIFPLLTPPLVGFAALWRRRCLQQDEMGSWCPPCPACPRHRNAGTCSHKHGDCGCHAGG